MSNDRRNQKEVVSEWEHQNDLFGNPPPRWERYKIARKRFRNENPKEIFFERETDEKFNEAEWDISSNETERLGGGSSDIDSEDGKNGQRGQLYSRYDQYNKRFADPKTAGALKAGGDTANLLVLNKGASQHYRVYGKDGLAPTLQSQSGMSSQKHPFIVSSTQKHATIMEDISSALTSAMGLGGGHIPMINAVRKLMPIECERLMSWPESVFYVKMELCLDQVKSYVNAVQQNPKLQKYVGIAEKQKDLLLARFVEKRQPINSVQESVITNGKKAKKKQIQNKKLNAEPVELQNESDHQKQDNFVPLNVSINLTEGQIIQDGLVESQVSVGKQILQVNGKDVLSLSGEEIMRLAKDVKSDFLTNPIKNFTPITLLDSSIDLQDLMLIILYLFATNAISGFTQEKILKKNLSLQFRVSDGGWTKYGIDDKGNKVEISDSQRYKMCGNGVVSNIVKNIIKFLIK